MYDIRFIKKSGTVLLAHFVLQKGRGNRPFVWHSVQTVRVWMGTRGGHLSKVLPRMNIQTRYISK